MSVHPAGSTAAATQALLLQVDRDTVLQARNALLSEVERLRKSLIINGHGRINELCGGDPISPYAKDAFNDRIDALMEGAHIYVDELALAVRALEDAARRYGYTEDQIAGSFVR